MLLLDIIVFHFTAEIKLLINKHFSPTFNLTASVNDHYEIQNINKPDYSKLLIYICR